MSRVVALISGVLFGLGLMLSGMADPDKVIGFLDVSRMTDGSWEPALMMVMLGALSLYIPVYYGFIRPRVAQGGKPLFDQSYQLPNKTKVDVKLLMGAGLFGVGWGLAGMCPGPAIVNLTSFDPLFVLFVLSMVLGMFLGRLWQSRRQFTESTCQVD
ncbi:DUF6691 family protein [Shewanella waksmanii]|uniref:DUF6691 family protein n=1 Tax=Shewanella waksmanii TaxID=213783 RepID=UPI0037362B28